jgi:hypothetical protein
LKMVPDKAICEVAPANTVSTEYINDYCGIYFMHI